MNFDLFYVDTYINDKSSKKWTEWDVSEKKETCFFVPMNVSVGFLTNVLLMSKGTAQS